MNAVVGRWLAAAVVLAGFFIPLLVRDAYYLDVLIRGALLGMAAMGIGFLMHQCGLVFFGVAAFIGMPAYMLILLLTQVQLGFVAALCISLVASVLLSFVVGAMFVRAKPLAFAMLTLALAQLFKTVSTLQVMHPITGGEDGLSMSTTASVAGLTQHSFADPATFWPIVWCALCLVVVGLWMLANSRFGQILRGIKLNEERMRFSGFNTFQPRLVAFVVCCFAVSLSGVLTALNTAFVSPEMLDFVTGGHALVAMLVGGLTTVLGPLLGALLYIKGQDSFGASGHLELLTGIAVVVVIGFFPAGVMGALQAVWRRIRR